MLERLQLWIKEQEQISEPNTYQSEAWTVGFLYSLDLELNYSNAKEANTDKSYSSYSFYSGRLE